VSDKPEKVRFSYIVPDGFAPIYANGAYGGVTPRGELVIGFFQERYPQPKTDLHPLTPEGQLGQAEQKAQSIVEVERHVVAGVILNEQAVRELQVWLTQRLDEMRIQREMQMKASSGPTH